MLEESWLIGNAPNFEAPLTGCLTLVEGIAEFDWEMLNCPEVARAANVDKALFCKLGTGLITFLPLLTTESEPDNGAVTIATVLFVFVCTPYER